MPIERAKPRVLEIPGVGAPPTPVVPEAERFTLESGLRVVAVRRSELPQVTARLLIPAGAVSDPPNAPGAASLIGSLLTEGTHRLTAVEVNDRIDGLGASLCARVGHDFAEVDLGLLAETLEEGLSLLAEIVAGAAFPEREVERVRAEALDALEGRLDEPANVADDEVAVAVFGPDHPYGRLPLGTIEGVRSLTRADLVELHRLRYRPRGSVLVIAGDFGALNVQRVLQEAFASWSGETGPIVYPSAPASARKAGNLSLVEWEDAAQTEIRIAGLGLPRASPDWVPAAIANYILGGSTITGRLGANLREDKGWTYGVRSGFAAGIQPGGWVIETAVDAEVATAALHEIEGELSRFTSEPVDTEELARAKEAMVLSLPRAFETADRIVARLATLEAFGLAPDYWRAFPDHVERVTALEVLEIARAYFTLNTLVRVMVGPNSSKQDQDDH